MTKYWIEATSQHKMVYCVESDVPLNAAAIQDLIDNGSLPEVGQKWLGEKIVGIREVDDETYLAKYDELNPDLVNLANEEKLEDVVNLTRLNEGTVDE